MIPLRPSRRLQSDAWHALFHQVTRRPHGSERYPTAEILPPFYEVDRGVSNRYWAFNGARTCDARRAPGGDLLAVTMSLPCRFVK